MSRDWRGDPEAGFDAKGRPKRRAEERAGFDWSFVAAMVILVVFAGVILGSEWWVGPVLR